MSVAQDDGEPWLPGLLRDFVSSLEGVASQLEKLLAADPERAVTLYETFLAGCYEKAEELTAARWHAPTLAAPALTATVVSQPKGDDVRPDPGFDSLGARSL